MQAGTSRKREPGNERMARQIQVATVKGRGEECDL